MTQGVILTEPSFYFRYCKTAFVIPNESEES